MPRHGTSVSLARRAGEHREGTSDDEAWRDGQRGPEPRWRIVVHDFAGHPFQVDLSRALVKRGHEVLHTYCASYTSGKGRLAVDPGDTGLSVVGLPVGKEFARYSPVRRVVQELAYGWRFATQARRFQPQVVVACNVPLIAQTVAAAWCRWRRVPWVFWIQDLYSVAVGAEARSRAGGVGRLLGRGFEVLERSLMRHASRVVPITDDFGSQLEQWGVEPTHCTVIENWAPLDDLPVRPRNNDWRRRQGLGDRFVFLYTGTLGLKHRPELLFNLALQHNADADVVVISEGRGATRLGEMLAARPLPNLKLLPFQSFLEYPDILASADVLVALLEPTAATYSVPSKVLSYLCAGRPILGAIPAENLAARTIERAGAGLVVSPNDEEAFLLAAKRWRNEPALRTLAGANARAFAEATFDTDGKAEQFLGVIAAALDAPRPAAAARA